MHIVEIIASIAMMVFYAVGAGLGAAALVYGGLLLVLYIRKEHWKTKETQSFPRVGWVGAALGFVVIIIALYVQLVVQYGSS